MIEPNLFLKNEVANIAGVQGVQWNPPLFPNFCNYTTQNYKMYVYLAIWTSSINTKPQKLRQTLFYL